MDGDGWDDLIIGSGKGGQLACYRNDTKGGFTRIDHLPWTTVASRDQTAIVGWQPGAVLVGTANYEDGLASGSAVQLCEWGRPQSQDSRPIKQIICDQQLAIRSRTMKIIKIVKRGKVGTITVDGKQGPAISVSPHY
jgi:hypothetical protein